VEALRQRLAAAEARGNEIERQAGELRQELAAGRQAAAKTGEEAATLRGKLEATEAQNAALLARLAPA
jgi:BMFP domain-containing protein YqiC